MSFAPIARRRFSDNTARTFPTGVRPMTHPNAALITRFYQAFQQLDAETMASCYSADVQFSDPGFTDLRGAAAGDMWRMLCAKAQGFSLTFDGLAADYYFRQTRSVPTHNFF